MQAGSGERFVDWGLWHARGSKHSPNGCFVRCDTLSPRQRHPAAPLAKRGTSGLLCPLPRTPECSQTDGYRFLTNQYAASPHTAGVRLALSGVRSPSVVSRFDDCRGCRRASSKPALRVPWSRAGSVAGCADSQYGPRLRSSRGDSKAPVIGIPDEVTLSVFLRSQPLGHSNRLQFFVDRWFSRACRPRFG